MKIRQGFVSNSSSSSFVINMNKLNKTQIQRIYDHINVCKNISEFAECACDVESLNFEWNISEDGDNITGECFMDNFDMGLFLQKLGVQDEDIEWDY